MAKMKSVCPIWSVTIVSASYVQYYSDPEVLNKQAATCSKNDLDKKIGILPRAVPYLDVRHGNAFVCAFMLGKGT